jgi:DNA polymerase-3 subunit epsilon
MLGLRSLFRVENATAPETRLDSLRYVVFDTEFTSLDQRANRLLSIGALVMEGARVRIGEQFYREVNPGVDVPGESVLVHRLRPDDIAGAESPQQVLQEFVSFSEAALLVGHFVHLDVDIVRKELAASGGNWKPTVIDTSRVHRWLEFNRQHYPVEAFDERTIKLDLTAVAQHYGVALDNAHHALSDAFMTAQIWQRQLAVLAARNIITWRQLRPAIK